jgi:hypothetical protein
MMGDLPDHSMWNEPLVGALFGDFYEVRNGDLRQSNFILAPEHRSAWINAIRYIVLTGAAARFPRLAESGYLVIKEPHGCLGARFLTEALPDSHMIVLVRDPRDVIASHVDAQRTGSWTATTDHWKGRKKPVGAADSNPDAFVRHAATEYVRSMEVVKQAYELHQGAKSLVKYEELRANTLEVLLRMCSELMIPVARSEAERVVEHRSWHRIPPHKKGPGQFYRKGVPGAWREDLTHAQIQVVQEITQPILEEFYAEEASLT